MHAKDVRRERGLVGVNGLIDTCRMDEIAKRSWNYVALGHGHDVRWWAPRVVQALAKAGVKPLPLSASTCRRGAGMRVDVQHDGAFLALRDTTLWLEQALDVLRLPA